MKDNIIIRTENLCKYYKGDIHALHNVTAEIEKGEVVVIIGPSGSGKSTFLRSLNLLESATSGKVFFEDVDITDKKVNINIHRQKMGMVFQQFNLFPHMTVLKNLTLAPMKLKKMPKAQAEEMALNLLERVGLKDRANAYPAQLSGGQKQRVAIVRALCMNPDVMLFDEPTSALDPVATAEVMDVMRRLKKEIPLVVITHKMAFVKEIADRVIFMQNGKICEEGKTKELLNYPKQPETISFLSYQKSLNYQIYSADFDRPELNARIECYCDRFGLGTQAFHYVQLVVEELLNLLPLDQEIRLELSKADDEVRMSLNVVMPATDRMYLDAAKAKDELSLSIITGLCEIVEETINEQGEKYIHLELNKDSLLMSEK